MADKKAQNEAQLNNFPHLDRRISDSKTKLINENKNLFPDDARMLTKYAQGEFLKMFLKYQAPSLSQKWEFS